jgi:L-ribulose-5-phosphate 4-epimerase
LEERDLPLMLPELREGVCRANLALVRDGLVTLSFGNASGVDRAAGVFVIKPSGLPYEELRPEHLVVVSLDDGRVVEGDLRPSSDTPTHLRLYQQFAEIGGVVHTHSRAATAWAQAGRPIPAFGTTHADHFHGPVPVTRQLTAGEVAGDYEAETGAVIVETLERLGLDPAEMPAVLVASHGPFTWGHDAGEAAENATALEAVAAMAFQTLALDPEAEPMADYLLERHFRRKQGPGAYYGQRRR